MRFVELKARLALGWDLFAFGFLFRQIQKKKQGNLQDSPWDGTCRLLPALLKARATAVIVAILIRPVEPPSKPSKPASLSSRAFFSLLISIFSLSLHFSINCAHVAAFHHCFFPDTQISTLPFFFHIFHWEIHL